MCNVVSFKKGRKQSLDRISVDRNCVLSLDRNYVNHLIEFFDTFHLIELFDQLIKKNGRILAVDQNFKKPKIPLLELSIKCQNPKVLFWQLIECTVG